MNLPMVSLFTRQQCCLCDEVKSLIERAVEQGLCRWESINVDTDKALLVKYGNDVPIVHINGKEAFRHRMSWDAFLQSLYSC